MVSSFGGFGPNACRLVKKLAEFQAVRSGKPAVEVTNAIGNRLSFVCQLAMARTFAARYHLVPTIGGCLLEDGSVIVRGDDNYIPVPVDVMAQD